MRKIHYEGCDVSRWYFSFVLWRWLWSLCAFPWERLGILFMYLCIIFFPLTVSIWIIMSYHSVNAGKTVYSSELLLNGIVTQKLEYERLFLHFNFSIFFVLFCVGVAYWDALLVSLTALLPHLLFNFVVIFLWSLVSSAKHQQWQTRRIYNLLRPGFSLCTFINCNDHFFLSTPTINHNYVLCSGHGA